MIQRLKLKTWNWLHICLVIVFLSFSLAPLGCSTSYHSRRDSSSYTYDKKSKRYRSSRYSRNYSSQRSRDQMEMFGTILLGVILISVTALTVHELSFRDGVTTIKISN
jgi:hypothetical protein